MRNIQTLEIEISKVANYISLEIVKEIFNFFGKIGYNLREQNIFRKPLVNSIYNDTESVSFL